MNVFEHPRVGLSLQCSSSTLADYLAELLAPSAGPYCLPLLHCPCNWRLFSSGLQRSLLFGCCSCASQLQVLGNARPAALPLPFLSCTSALLHLAEASSTFHWPHPWHGCSIPPRFCCSALTYIILHIRSAQSHLSSEILNQQPVTRWHTPRCHHHSTAFNAHRQQYHKEYKGVNKQCLLMVQHPRFHASASKVQLPFQSPINRTPAPCPCTYQSLLTNRWTSYPLSLGLQHSIAPHTAWLDLPVSYPPSLCPARSTYCAATWPTRCKESRLQLSTPSQGLAVPDRRMPTPAATAILPK